jgi:hypothetical protein
MINAKINGGSFRYLPYGGDIQLIRFFSVFKNITLSHPKSFAINIFTIGVS